MRRIVIQGPQRLVVLVISVILGAGSAVALQQRQDDAAAHQPSSAAARLPESKPAWSVRVASKRTPVTLTIRATNAPLAKIGEEIGRQLNVPVALSPLMAKQRVTLDVADLPLESVLRMLAPQVYIDYVVGGDYSIPPQYAAVYLSGYNEPLPKSKAAEEESIRQTIMFEGNISVEELSSPRERTSTEPPVQVKFADNKLTVRARRQPLSVVLYEMATAAGIPLDIQYEDRELVDVEFSDYTLEQAVRRLPPAARLYIRTDVVTMASKPLRFAIVAANKSTKKPSASKEN